MSDQAQPKLSDAEVLKAQSNFLRGTIRQSLADRLTGAVSEGDAALLKFHGTYQQDDRDLRNERAEQKLEPAFDFMIRVRSAGGVVTPAQWLALDEISTKFGGGGLRLTTRQSFELHGVMKWKLRDTFYAIHQTLLTTLATCGDVNRNVMCSPNPPQTKLHQEVYDWSAKMSAHLLPQTTAYHELWIGDEKVVDTQADHEPLYGPTYLPRKFKIGVAVPPQNDVDVFTQDLGFIAIVEKDRLAGFNVVVGGGMGMTHGEPATFPNPGWVIGFTPAQRAVDVAEKVLLVQRDYGDRTNRKHARLKYTITDRGVDWFQAELNKYLGWSLEPERPYKFEHRGDRYGWTKGLNGHWNLTLYIENGRILDWEGYPLLSGLRAIAAEHQGDFRLTANQNLILGNIPDSARPRIEELVAQYNISDGRRNSLLRQNAMACVALPKCSLAMAEAERYMPSFLDRLEQLFAELGLADDEIVVRMTGCPNGCARPFVAEIALVGKALGKYNLYLGADFIGSRLNKLYRENIGEDEIFEALRPVLQRYAQERQPGERFGDFCIRAGIVRETLRGTDFHTP